MSVFKGYFCLLKRSIKIFSDYLVSFVFFSNFQKSTKYKWAWYHSGRNWHCTKSLWFKVKEHIPSLKAMLQPTLKFSLWTFLIQVLMLFICVALGTSFNFWASISPLLHQQSALANLQYFYEESNKCLKRTIARQYCIKTMHWYWWHWKGG